MLQREKKVSWRTFQPYRPSTLEQEPAPAQRIGKVPKLIHTKDKQSDQTNFYSR